jgi:hypothetical protein
LEEGHTIEFVSLWLGHESSQTTHLYTDIDLVAKEDALGKLAPTHAASFRFKPADSVLAFLKQL